MINITTNDIDNLDNETAQWTLALLHANNKNITTYDYKTPNECKEILKRNIDLINHINPFELMHNLARTNCVMNKIIDNFKNFRVDDIEGDDSYIRSVMCGAFRPKNNLNIEQPKNTEIINYSEIGILPPNDFISYRFDRMNTQDFDNYLNNYVMNEDREDVIVEAFELGIIDEEMLKSYGMTIDYEEDDCDDVYS